MEKWYKNRKIGALAAHAEKRKGREMCANYDDRNANVYKGNISEHNFVLESNIGRL